MDWNDLATGGKDAVIAGLDIRAVAAATGVVFDGPEGLACCPFHAEKTGSFNVFIGDDGKQRFMCHGCGARGDVIDFVGRRLGLNYAEAVARCGEFLAEGLPAPQALAPANPADLARVMDEARAQGPEVISGWLADRGSLIPPTWLIETFRLGVNARGEIVIPHYGRGEDSPRAVKRRDGQRKAAYSGSRLTELYGAWRDRGAPRVVLCEGESDTWTAAYLLRGARVDVLGLPRGVGSAVDPSWLDQLKGREVVLLFDADDAGRAGMRRWVTALRGEGTEARLALLPETADASSVSGAEVLDALTRAQPAPNFTDLPVFASKGRYLLRKPKKGDGDGDAVDVLTDWTLEVLGRTEVAGESVHYTVRLPNQEVTRISNADLRNADTLSRWANRWGLTHAAGGFSVQHLMRLLEAESVYAPRRRGVMTAGWHDGRFVLPDRTLGCQDLEYVPPALDVRWEKRLALGEVPSGGALRSAVPVLAGLHTPAVMTPVLGWLAAAPLRALCAQFPTLAVMGSAGSGKTTIVAAALATFGFSNGTPVTVSNSTWHAVWAMAGSTNGLPVWFDEYRAGTRADGVAALEQVIRDAWNGAATLRGGMGENKSAINELVATAPIVVSGEGAFQEASHAERSVYVTLTRTGRNPDALGELRRLDTRGLGLDYLGWLVRQGLDRLPAPPEIPDRPQQAVAVARWGYELLLEWLDTSDLADRMPAWDESLIRLRQRELLASNPYLEALRECLDQFDGTLPLVWREGNDLLVRFGRIPVYVKQKTTIVLPGGERALLSWLQEHYDVHVEQGASGRLARLANAATALSVSHV